jgi:hypothetical protein
VTPKVSRTPHDHLHLKEIASRAIPHEACRSDGDWGAKASAHSKPEHAALEHRFPAKATEVCMNETFSRFESLAEKARAGDRSGEEEFFAEAARLFPQTFGPDAPEPFDASGPDKLDRALAIIRQTVTTGG